MPSVGRGLPRPPTSSPAHRPSQSAVTVTAHRDTGLDASRQRSFVAVSGLVVSLTHESGRWDSNQRRRRCAAQRCSPTLICAPGGGAPSRARHPSKPFQWEHRNMGREPSTVNCPSGCRQSRCRLRSYPSCGNDNSASWSATRWTTSSGTDSTGTRWVATGTTKNHPEGEVANRSAPWRNRDLAASSPPTLGVAAHGVRARVQRR